MLISEAAAKSGLSIDTIRFFERSGLLPPIRRGKDGRRYFVPHDIEWLALLASLRATGMPMTQMRRFAELYRAGHSTIPQRRQILYDHADQIAAQRRALDHCAEMLDYKLKCYDDIEGA